MPSALHDRQRQLVNFVCLLVGTVLLLNYNDLADPMNDNENVMQAVVSDWCGTWNEICGIRVEPYFPLYCSDADAILNNETLSAAIIQYSEDVLSGVFGATFSSVCAGFAQSLDDQQDDYDFATSCQFQVLGTTVTGIFVLLQLFFGLVVYMPSVKPDKDDGITRADPSLGGGFGGTCVAVLCGTMEISAKRITRNSTKRLFFVLLFLAQTIVCACYVGMLFLYWGCYSTKKMFYWFFVCMMVVCLGNAFMMTARWWRERKLEQFKRREKQEKRDREAAADASEVEMDHSATEGGE
ncbi:hypothetical protein Pelo_5721 [Pelomyxa schiedti]|nr:hypothetical protein Pelo_5721 [Pelomyxa schiedti]